MSQNNSENGSKILAQALMLVDTVKYQKGAVVSKTLMDKEAGTITLFAFDENQGLSEHTAPFDALVYVFDGKAEVTISGEPIVLTQGMFTIMPAEKPHSLKAIKPFKMMLIMVRA